MTCAHTPAVLKLRLPGLGLRKHPLTLKAHVQSQVSPEGLFLCVYHISLTFCLSNLYVCLKYKLICKIDTIFYHFGKFCNLQKYYSTECIVCQGERGGRGVDSACFLVDVSVELGSGNLLTEKGQMV